MKIGIQGPKVVLVSDNEMIRFAWMKLGYCSACKKVIAYDGFVPELFELTMKASMKSRGIELGYSKYSCIHCKDIVLRAMKLILDNKGGLDVKVQ